MISRFHSPCHSERGDSRARDLTLADAVDVGNRTTRALCSAVLLASAQLMSRFRKVPPQRLARSCGMTSGRAILLVFGFKCSHYPSFSSMQDGVRDSDPGGRVAVDGVHDRDLADDGSGKRTEIYRVNAFLTGTMHDPIACCAQKNQNVDAGIKEKHRPQVEGNGEASECG